jgi:hypothetical protein
MLPAFGSGEPAMNAFYEHHKDSIRFGYRRGGRRLGVCWGLVLGVGAVVEAAIGERAAQPFVEEENEPGNPSLRRGRL